MDFFPKFYIVGAAKAGTTSLWKYLQEHPGVFMVSNPIYKELGYFSDFYGLTKGFGINDRNQYLNFFKNAKSNQIIGEACNAYLSSPGSAANIAKEVPGAKIIIMLRNPVTRAYSLYNWMVNNGYEWVSTFEKALKIESKRIANPSFLYNNPQYYYNYLYYSSGLYYDQIKEYIDVFSKKQIHVILYEDFIKHTEKHLYEIYNFLGLPKMHSPNLKEIYNKGSFPRNVRLQFFIKQKLERNISFLHLKSWYIDKIKTFLLKLNEKEEYKKMKIKTRDKLRKLYIEDIKKTEKILGYKIKAWEY